MKEVEIVSSLFLWGVLIFIMVDNAISNWNLKKRTKDTNKKAIEKLEKEIEKYNDLLEENNRKIIEKLNELSKLMKEE